jgi:hypothetical protein
MDTTIGYLHEVREDLLTAAWRPGRRGRRQLLSRWRWSGPSLVAAVSVFCLVAAGATGWFITRNGAGVLHEDIRAVGRATTPPSGDQAARNAFVGFDASAVPSASPAPGVPGGILDVGGSATGGPNAVTDLSKIVRTANISVVVPVGSFGKTFAAASSVPDEFGGFVETSSTGARSGSITMRISSDRLGEALDRIRALGHVEAQTIAGRDVTANYIDLAARLRIAKARRLVLLRLMNKANSIEQTIRVQNALDDTQLQIEDLQGGINVLEDRTSFATARLELREQGVQAATHVEKPSIPGAWERSVAGFIGVIVAVIVGLGYVIPVALLLGLAWLVVVRVRRRRIA